MPTVTELYDYLDLKIPSYLSCDWDNDGLMCCPSPGRPVRRALLTLDISEGAVDHAVKNGFDVIVSHHPLIFHPMRRADGLDGVSRKVMELIRASVAAMSFHTRLDALDGGVNDALAGVLGLEGVLKFECDGKPIGRVGNLASPVSAGEFAARAKAVLNAPAALFCDCGKKISSVAVVGGDGKDFVADAIGAGADAYLSGRMSYNVMAEGRERGVSLFELGHYCTEFPVCHVLERLIKEFDGGIETEIFDSNLIECV